MTEYSGDQSLPPRQPHIPEEYCASVKSPERRTIPPGEHQHAIFSIWAGPGSAVSTVAPWCFPTRRRESNQTSGTLENPTPPPLTHQSPPNRLPLRFGRSLFADEREKHWGWQFPLFDGFFGPLPPSEDLAVPEDLDDTLPPGDMPGQLFLDLGF